MKTTLKALQYLFVWASIGLWLTAHLLAQTPGKGEGEAAPSPSDARTLLQQAIGFYNGTAGKVDDEKAKALFIEAGSTGDPLAMMWLALCHYIGLCNFPENVERGQQLAKEAIEEIQCLAKQSDPDAALLLGIAYEYGLAVSQDAAQAVSWYRQAAEKGDASAMFNLGWMYDNGKGVPQDVAQAVSWYRQAAEKGNASAMNNLGVMYQHGEGVPQDDGQALFWYGKAAEKGHAGEGQVESR
ncbi:sel1 repeat family protein [Candidatus Poribacteria bacterium]|nr:sel1 repeat family protein [Candidatus Poribacteria bacterium]